MNVKSCPGAANIKGTPTLKIKKCPACGGEVELFSTDIEVKCPSCGLSIYNDIQSCIKWCAYARECIGPEHYEALLKGNEKL